jgi:hypothetical protein
LEGTEGRGKEKNKTKFGEQGKKIKHTINISTAAGVRTHAVSPLSMALMGAAEGEED